MMTVLIVEDDAAIGRLVADQLASCGMVPTVFASKAASIDAVRRQQFDIVILDLTLPDGSGLDVLGDLRRLGSSAHVIVLSGASSELDRVQALGLGADDYVVKPFFARELAARVLAAQRRRDPGEDKQLRAGHLEIDIAARTVSAAGRQVELTSMEFDLLAFLAARPGHVFSRDDLLRSVWHSAAEWQQASTVTEHVRRIRSKLEDPEHSQLLQTVRGVGYRFEKQANAPPRDASGAVVERRPGTLVHVDGRIVAADRRAATICGWEEGELLGKSIAELVAPESLEALHPTLKALAVGRKPRSRLFTLTRADGGLVTEVQRALDADQFEVYYQPLVDLETGLVIAVEGLVRWNHPDRGLVGPHEFVNGTERTGLFWELGRLALELASTEGARRAQAGFEMDIALKLSRGELADPHLVNRVLTTLSATGMSPQRLWLGVTETALVDGPDQAASLQHLADLADLGVRLSIDDFGTGWASLTYLKQLPVHALKINRTFVGSIVHDVNDAAVVRSIVQLGAELGLAVVAEGVESAAQQQALQDLGCTIGQGLPYGGPTSAGEMPVHWAIPGAWPGGSSGGQQRRTNVTVATTAPLTRPGAQPSATSVSFISTDIEVSALRGLLRIQSAGGAAELLQHTARQLGAELVPADEAGADALPLDLSLGEGPPLLADVDPLSPARMALESILPRLVEDARRAVDLLRQTERLDDESNHDKLTGLANRRVLERVLARAGDGTVVMIDLDKFKRINDTLGHAAGDAVLAQFGRTLSAEVRVSDTPCRLGGDEFVVIAPGMDEAGACELVDRVRAAWVEVAPHPVTFSAGVASVNAPGGTSALLAADRALYRGKQRGRDRTEVQASPSMREAHV